MKNHALKFARWILKYCNMGFDRNNGLCYQYEGIYYNTDELYEIFRQFEKL